MNSAIRSIRRTSIVIGLSFMVKRNRYPSARLTGCMKSARNQAIQRRPVFTVNNLYGMHLAVQGGLGLANFPDYMVASESDLVRVLLEIQSPPTQCAFVYPEEMRHSKRVEVFREFCCVKWLKRRSDL